MLENRLVKSLLHATAEILFLTVSNPAFAAPADSPVVLELFTSQSCSSCPPADALLAKLNTRRNIIALGCHIDYWNHLDWVDTLTSHACTARQNAYAAAFSARGVYTPQLIIDGHEVSVGRDEAAVLGIVEAEAGKVAPIEISISGDAIGARLPQLPPEQAADLTLEAIAFGKSSTVQIRAGENSGSTLAYTNPVRRFVELGEWDGRERTVMLRRPEFSPEDAGFAVFAKEGKAGRIVAAGKMLF